MAQFTAHALLVTWSLLCPLVVAVPIDSGEMEASQSLASPEQDVRHRKHHSRTHLPLGPFLDKEFNPELFSNRVMFTAHKPSVPPFLEAMAGTFEPEQEELLRQHARRSEGPEAAGTAEDGEPDSSSADRHKRSVPPLELDNSLVVPACESTSQWAQKISAEDMWGNTFTVLQEIDIGGSRVNQYFYETTCRNQGTPGPNHTPASCNGIDSTNFVSMCMEKFMWVYAKVMDSFGQTGWTLVKVSGSCNCGLLRRQRSTSPLDLS